MKDGVPTINSITAITAHHLFAMNKTELRKKILNIRSNADSEQCLMLSDTICEKFLNSEIYKNATQIFAYSSIKNEVCCNKTIAQALKDGKKVALPKVLSANDSNMEFYYLDDKISTENGYMGISEPTDLTAVAIPDGQTVIVTPGIVFDRNFHRIGFGKGFYDRYFNKYAGDTKKVALCYDFQLLDGIPSDCHDIPVDVIITENVELVR